MIKFLSGGFQLKSCVYHILVSGQVPLNYKETITMLTRYEKFHLPTLDLLDSFGFFGELSNAKPKSDVIDDEGIKIEMPGVSQTDLDVSVEGRILKVSGKSRHGKDFSYSYTLRGTVDESLIKARLQDGLLEISLPKKADSKARKIPIT